MSEAADGEQSVRERKEIALSNLTLDTAQSRQVPWDGDKSDERLINSLEQDGVLHPLLVRPVSCASYGDEIEEDYAIIAGSRRFEAATRAGFDTVRCLIIEADDATAAEKSLRENRNRKDLTEVQVAQSLRVQFELRRPPKTTACPGDCDYIIKRGEHGAAVNHLRHCDAPTDILSEETPSDSNPEGFFTDTQLVDYLSVTYFGETGETQRRKVKNYLEVAELPNEVQSLWKSGDDRVDISQDVSVAGGGSSLSNRIVNLYSQLVESSDEVDPVGATLDAVESLDDGVGDSQALSEAISDYSSEVSERLDESDGRDDPVVKETLNSHVSELKQTSAEETSGGEIDTQLEFENDKYLRWHARLKQLRGVEDDSTPLEELYRKHLDEIAEEQGWE